MSRKILLINIIVSLVLALAVSFLIVPTHMCTVSAVGSIGCDFTPLPVRLVITVILFIVTLGLVYLAEFLFNKLKK